MSSLTVLFKKSRQSLMYCSIAALTMGVEEIVEEVVFNCPCQRHFVYGQAFLWGPAFLLFFPGILLDKTSWPRTGPRKNNVGKARSKLVLRYLKLLFATFHAMTRASIAPVAWLVLSFLQQKYYTSAYFARIYARSFYFCLDSSMRRKRKVSTNRKSWILQPCWGQRSFRAVPRYSKRAKKRKSKTGDS